MPRNSESQSSDRDGQRAETGVSKRNPILLIVAIAVVLGFSCFINGAF